MIVLWSLPVSVVIAIALSYTMYSEHYGDEDEQDINVKNDYKHFDRMCFLGFIVIYMISISVGLSATIWSITSEIMPGYLLS